MVKKGPEWRRRFGAGVGHRSTGGLPSAESVSPDEWTLRPRIPIPIASSILWQPVGSPPAADGEDSPIFVARAALTAIHDHMRAAPGDRLLGFLIGNIAECPETKVHYVVIHTTFSVPARLENDDSLRLVTQTWPAVRQVARKGGADVLGWYHSHAMEGVALTPRDVETHLTYFPAPWHCALVIAAQGDELTGGFFHVAANDAWPRACVPFYELLGPEQPGTSGGSHSLVPWSNYRSQAPALESRAPATAAPAVSLEAPAQPMPGLPASPTTFIHPEAFDAEALPVRQPDRLARAVRGGAAGFGLVALIALVYGLWHVWQARQPAAERTPSLVASAPGPGRLDGLTDTVEQALRAYSARAQLFANHQMICADLASGLVAVDDQWLRYSVARRAEAQAIDSLKDEALAARVTGVERQFDASGCPRP